MATNKAELEIIKQLFQNLNADDKKLFLKSIKEKEQISKKLNFTRDLTNCPHYHSKYTKSVCNEI